MADEILITKIRTEQGDGVIDYNFLGNKPFDKSKSEFEQMINAKQNADSAITKSNILTFLDDKSVANADKLGGKAASEYALASEYMKINKDSRPLILTSGVHYGDNLPSTGVVGQIFLKKV